MLYILFTTYHEISPLMTLVTAILALVGISFHLLLSGSSIRRQASGYSRQLVLLKLFILIAVSIWTGSLVVMLTAKLAVQVQTSAQAQLPDFLQIIIGAPDHVDQLNLIKFSGILLGAIIGSNLLVLSQLRIGSSLRLWLDRFRAISRSQDEYGSSHFATQQEYRRFRVPKSDGISFFGKFFGKATSKNSFTYLGEQFCLSAEDTARGMLTIGNPGSGKTSSVILPVVFDTMISGHSMVIADPQHELSQHILRYARITGHQVVIHNPLHPLSPRFNLAHAIQSVSDARAVADVLVPHSTGDLENFWNQSAAMLLAACLLRFDHLGEIFAHFNDLKALGNLLDEKQDDAQRLAGVFINSTRSDMKLATNIVATLSTSLSAWADDEVCESTSACDFTAKILVAKKPTIVLLTCPGRYRQILAPYLGAVMTRLLRDLDAFAERLPDGKHSRTIRFVIDEFPTLGNLIHIVESVNLVRKRQISFLLAAQTLGQLEHIYGRDGVDVLLSGMAFQIVFGGCDQTTAEFYSRATGTSTKIRKSGNQQSESKISRKLLTPDEVIRPPQGNSIIFGRYVTREYATYVILLARLTRIYEREDVRQYIKEIGTKRVKLLRRTNLNIRNKSQAQMLLATPLCTRDELEVRE